MKKEKRKKRKRKKQRETSKPSINSCYTGKATIMPFLTLRLFAREMIRRLGDGAQVEEVYLAPFRGKDYRHKTVCHTGEARVLRFCLQSLGDAG